MTTLHEWDIRNADGYSELMEKAQTPEEKKELAAAIEMKLKTMLTED
ncbi:MAG: hypothetical protein GTO54_10235, partial [Nitrososphaeria archaeon]|nr:hypothetical protein [Nitrososphaeria archaeon]